MDEALKKYLESKYDPAVLASEDADRDIQGNTNAALMRSAAQIGTFGGKTSDASPFADTVKANQAARARSSQGYNAAQEAEGARAMRGAQAEKLGAETAAIQGDNDPMSQSSVAFRATLKKAMPSLASMEGFEGMSAAQLQKVLPLVKDQFKPKDVDTLAQQKFDLDRQKFLYQQQQDAKPKDKTPDQIAKETERQNKIDESTYRKNILTTNAKKLKGLIEKVGTMEMTGPEGAEMDSIMYQMAVDYAKLVDPDSVAREGEVAAAQKYMLPIRNMGGLAYSNDTAQEVIDKYIAGLDERVAAREGSKAKNIADYVPETPGSGGTAVAAPAGMTPQQKSRLEQLRAKHGGQ